MANEQNLIPNSERSPEELRENGRKGGIKSGEVRRRRKTFKEEMLVLLDADDGRYKKSIIAAIIKKAEKGHLEAYEEILKTIGENSADKVEVNQNGGFEVNINVLNSVQKNKKEKK